MEIPVLDKGFIRLVEFAGGDESIVQAARVSYDKGLTTPEKDKKLVSYLLEHDHGTPFEHCYFKFHVKAPIFVFRQWHRHRIGVSYNEMSARYSEMKDDFYFPQAWRAQDVKNKQGSMGVVADQYTCRTILEETCRMSMKNYQLLLSYGVAKEMARMVLPVNLYSEMYFTCNARSLMAFCKLRSDSHAQWEIRQYSDAILTIFSEKMPWTYEAFVLRIKDQEEFQAWKVKQKNGLAAITK